MSFEHKNIIESAKLNLKILMDSVNLPGHDYIHCINVWKHSVEALKYENLNNTAKLQIELAALLHDADDKKIFKKFNDKYCNARSILNKVCDKIENKEIFINVVIDMITLVSCSENRGSSDVCWMNIPTDCDRLEAIGEVGIKRCEEYSNYIGRHKHTEKTFVALNDFEIDKAATKDRFENYKLGVKSSSMIDHFYDKLLHIGKPENLHSKNKYILSEAAKRNNVMRKFVIDYWFNILEHH